MLAVPTTPAEYQCIINTAGQGFYDQGLKAPFWTGVVINGQNQLTGIDSATNYTDIGFFGKAAAGILKRPGVPSVYWAHDSFSKLASATKIFFHNGYYVAAEDTFFNNWMFYGRIGFVCEG